MGCSRRLLNEAEISGLNGMNFASTITFFEALPKLRFHSMASEGRPVSRLRRRLSNRRTSPLTEKQRNVYVGEFCGENARDCD
jgi:hypothetical protein